MTAKAMYTKRGRYGGGTHMHPYLAIKFLIDNDPRALIFMLDIASESLAASEIYKRVAARIKLEGSYEPECKSQYVYLIHADGTTHYKVGISNSPANRCDILQTGHPMNLAVIATRECINADELEKEIHEYLNPYTMRGEWFDLDMTALMKLINTFFQPNI